MTTWGIVSTIKAPARDVLNFCAWHIDLGAHRMFIHLDAPDPDLFALLKAHPRIRPVTCDETYWKRLGKARPKKHQVRQSHNATRTYLQRADVDWLAHIDVDEFILADRPIPDLLDASGPECQVARMRPIESLSPSDTPNNTRYFKDLVADRKERLRLSSQVWPTYGAHLQGGFLSHVAGKIFARTGVSNAEFRIHNLLVGDKKNPGQQELGAVRLAHLHAKTWDDFLGQYRFRLDRGSYRAELKPARPQDQGGLTLHDLFQMIEAEGGETALRHFFDEVCAATPEHLDRLENAGLLVDLGRDFTADLDRVRQKHFPGAG